MLKFCKAVSQNATSFLYERRCCGSNNNMTYTLITALRLNLVFFLTECVDELYSIPFTPELLLAGYLTEQKVYVERKWLTDEIKTDLLSGKFQQKGVLLAADLGYGKTAFISHMICANENKQTWNFRNRILAYHICKYDILLTRNPAFFIRRLIGMIAMRLPEFGNQVSMLSNTSIIFDRYLSEYDANGCFDQGILFPLRRLTEIPHQRFIIVIDALDECSDGYGKTNHVSELIRKRAHKLPSWIGFLITSRNTSEIRLLKDFRVKILLSNDPRNFNDIREYIVKQKESLLLQLKQLFGIDSDSKLIDKLVYKSAGNFLFLTHAFEFWLSSNRTIKDEEVPSSLDKIYELNFERIFGTDEDSFQNAKLVLEVACAALHQLNESELIVMLSITNITSLSNTDVQETLRRLSMFLKNDNGTLMFTHISIRNWLVSKDNLRFPISIENGAKILSEYLFHMLRLEYNSTSFVELVLHVSQANSSDCEEKFRSAAQNKTREIIQTNVLHRIVETVDNPKAIDLVAAFYENIDLTNENNFSPACIAAIKGHTDAFKRLFELGANINFTVNTDQPRRQHYLIVNIMIDIFKQKLENYNLLHIATQFGHISIVKYILTKQRSLMYSETAFGYLPMHLACEFGRKDILTFFFNNKYMMPDYLCLYLAAKNQQESIVELIFDTFTPVYKCIFDEEAEDIFYSIRISKKSLDSVLNIRSNHEATITNNKAKITSDTNASLITFSNELVYPLDVWWRIRQDTPLHIAVRNGNVFISKLIASMVPMSLSCVDGGGLTPFLTSVRYQKVALFKEFLNRRWTDNCTGPTSVFKHLDTVYEQPQILHGYPIQSTCIKGMTLTHFLAASGDKDTISYFLKTGHELQYLLSDINGATPLHYAACAGNTFFLIAASKLGANFSISARNGSTPYHSATICFSFVGLYTLFQENGSPYVVDSSNMSLGLYLVSTPIEQKLNNSNKELTENAAFILEMLLNVSLQFIINRDNMKRNFFHYALRNGHYRCIQYLLKKMPVLSLELLLDPDKNGENPVSYAVRRLNDSNIGMSGVYYLPKACSYIDVLRSKECMQATPLESLMSPVELSLLYVMMYTDYESAKVLFENHFARLIVHSKMYLVPYFILRFARNVNDSSLKRQIFKALERQPKPYNILSIAFLIPDKLSHCDNSYSDPPLHVLAKWMDEIIKVFVFEPDFTIIMQLYKTNILRCLDSSGHTLLQRAIKEKAFLFSSFLIKFFYEKINYSHLTDNLLTEMISSDLVTQTDRILISNRQTEVQDLLYKSLSGKMILKYNRTVVYDAGPFESKLAMVTGQSDDTKSIDTKSLYQDKKLGVKLQTLEERSTVEEEFTVMKDELVSEVIILSLKHLNFNIFCNEGSSLFSLVHLLAVNNMHETLFALKKHAPVSVLRCSNKHGVTPVYLAKMFHAERAFKLLQNETIPVTPSRAFEETLLFKLLSSFIDSDITYPLFFLQNNIPISRMTNERKISQTIKALMKAKLASKLYKYTYSKYLPLFSINSMRVVRTAGSLTSAILFGKYKYHRCFQTKLFLLSYQHFLSKIARCTCLADHFRSYSFLWENFKLFNNFEKCSVLRTNLKIILSLRQFSKAFMVFLMKRFHNYLFNVSIKETKMTFNNDGTEFYKLYIHYHPRTRINVTESETPSPNDFAKFRYIDILKGAYIRRFRHLEKKNSNH